MLSHAYTFFLALIAQRSDWELNAWQMNVGVAYLKKPQAIFFLESIDS